MPRLDYAIVDVFTAQRYAGTPAAVVMGTNELSAEQMGLISREFNLKETTFVSTATTPDAALAMRWFTPRDEITASSHGSLAAVHALIESGRFVSLPDDKGTILPIQTSNGTLTVRCERLPAQRGSPFLVWLDLPRPQLRRRPWAPRLMGELLDVPRDAFELAVPSVQTAEGDVVVLLKSLPPLMEACPDFRELAAFSCQQGVRAWCLATTATLTPSIDVQSRVFAPARGVDEDPVTGHIQGQLAAYLVSRDLVPTFGDAAAVTCTQSDSRARAGLVRAVVARRDNGACDVRIAGQCVTVMTGTLHA